MHHYFGSIQPQDGETERYAQLYVSDPLGQEAVTVKKRASFLHLPASVSSREKATCMTLLKELAATLRSCNPYVRDIITAGEIMSSNDDIPERTFVIDNEKRDPTKAHAGVYSNNGTRRTFVEVKVLCDEVPAKNAIDLCFVIVMGGCLKRTRPIVPTTPSILCCSSLTAITVGTHTGIVHHLRYHLSRWPRHHLLRRSMLWMWTPTKPMPRKPMVMAMNMAVPYSTFGNYGMVWYHNVILGNYGMV